MLITILKYLFGFAIIVTSIALCVKSVVGLISKCREYKEEKKGVK